MPKKNRVEEYEKLLKPQISKQKDSSDYSDEEEIEDVEWYGGEDEVELQRDLYQLDESKLDEKKPNGILYKRTETLEKPDYFVQPRSTGDFYKFKDTWDVVVLRLNRVPQTDYIREKTSQKRSKEYKSIFGERRNFSKAMVYLFESQESKKNALEYAKQFDNSLSGDFWQKALVYHAKNIQGQHSKKLIHSMEWLHSIANSLGGPIMIMNGAAGGYGANTQMAVIETALYRQPGISVEVETYTKPNTRVAEWYVYRVIAHDMDGKEFKSREFHIDGKRQWYNQADSLKDQAAINEFLEETFEQRKEAKVSDFELPEIIELRFINEQANKLVADDRYLEEGPLYGTPHTKDQFEFLNYDYREFFAAEDKDWNVEATTYAGYRERMAERYPFHQADILDAIESKNINELEEVLSNYGLDINAKDWKGNTLLHYAAQYNNPELINALLKDISFEAKVDSRNKDGITPLHLASKYGQKDAISSLLENQADINVTDNQGRAALHFAVHEENRQEIISQLLQVENIEYDIQDIHGNNFLHYLIKIDDGYTKWTFEHYIDEETTFEPEEENVSKVFNQLLNRANNVGELPLFIAARFNNVSAINALIVNNKFDLYTTNNEGLNAMHVAAENGSVASIVAMSKIEQDREQVKLLLDQKDKNGLTPLHLAAKYGQLEVIDKLLALGSNVNAKDHEGNTPLHLAAQLNRPLAIKLLIDKDTNVDSANNFGNTPLHLAAKHNSSDAIAILFDNGADFLPNNLHQLPLHLALEKSINLQALFVLQQKLVNNDNWENYTRWQDSDGNTPLFLAGGKDNSSQRALNILSNTYNQTSESIPTDYNSFSQPSKNTTSTRNNRTPAQSSSRSPFAYGNRYQRIINDKINLNYRYADDDINDYTTKIIQDNLGGFKAKGDGTYHHYLLNKSFVENGRAYIVAVTPAIDSAGTSTPIDYFFSSKYQPSQAVAEDIKNFLHDELLTELKAIHDKDGNEKLKLKIKEILTEVTGDPKQHDETLTRLALELTDANFGKNQLEERIKKLDEFTDKRNVLDEVINGLAGVTSDPAYAKILFPYNVTQSHWLTAEVIIEFKGGAYSIDIYNHDPYGGNSSYNPMPEELFSRLKNAIKEKLPDAVINNQVSEYNQRQSFQDGASCGVIVADDIIKRIEGKTLAMPEPYSAGASDLRVAQNKVLPPPKPRSPVDSSNFNIYRYLKSAVKKTTIQRVIKGQVNLNYRYADDDINDYTTKIIQDNLGGFKAKGDGTYHHYLLNKSFVENGRAYIVAVTPAIDSAGTSTPIDYFFSSKYQPSQAVAEDIKNFLHDELLTELKAIHDKDGNEKLKLKIKEILTEVTGDPKQHDETLTRLALELTDANFGKNQLEERIKKLDEFTDKRNVLDEVINGLAGVTSDPAYAKILFPYNVTQSHWLTAEVIIEFKGGAYSIDIYNHDPYGGNSLYNPMPEELFSRLENAIKEKLPDAIINNQVSEYNQRQSFQDGASCGVIVADDIIKRIEGKNLNVSEPYPVGAKALRQEQNKFLPKPNNFANPKVKVESDSLDIASSSLDKKALSNYYTPASNEKWSNFDEHEKLKESKKLEKLKNFLTDEKQLSIINACDKRTGMISMNKRKLGEIKSSYNEYISLGGKLDTRDLKKVGEFFDRHGVKVEQDNQKNTRLGVPLDQDNEKKRKHGNLDKKDNETSNDSRKKQMVERKVNEDSEDEKDQENESVAMDEESDDSEKSSPKLG